MIWKGKSISHGVAALEYDLAKEIVGQAAATEIARPALYGRTRAGVELELASVGGQASKLREVWLTFGQPVRGGATVCLMPGYLGGCCLPVYLLGEVILQYWNITVTSVWKSIPTEESRKLSMFSVVGCTSTQARTCLTTSYRNRTVSDWDVLRYAQPKTVKAPNWALTVPGSF